MKSSPLISFRLFFLGTFVLSLFSACYYDNEEELYPDPGPVPCDTVSVSYANTVLPIIQDNCYVCHDQGSGFGNVVLEGHDNITIYANNGRLYGSIAHLSGFSNMPQGRNKLADCKISQIKSWIDAGAPNN